MWLIFAVFHQLCATVQGSKQILADALLTTSSLFLVATPKFCHCCPLLERITLKQGLCSEMMLLDLSSILMPYQDVGTVNSRKYRSRTSGRSKMTPFH